MAYVATPTYSAPKMVGGRTHRHVRVEETGAGNASETSFAVPEYGTLVGFSAVKTAGDGATIQTALGISAGFSASDPDSQQQDAAAVSYDDETGWRFYAPDGVLYLRSTPASGSNNAISTVFRIVDGWT